MTDQIYDGRQSDAMRPILSFSGNRRWIHGYRDAPAPAASTTRKVSAIALTSGAPAAIRRTSFKTALVRDMSVRRTLARLSIGNELTKMLERLPPRGAK
jgi:hypothetical protein